jgi:hypothetical protein
VVFPNSGPDIELEDGFGIFFHPQEQNMVEELAQDTLEFLIITGDELELAFHRVSKTAVAGRSTICYHALEWVLEDHGS